MNFIPRPRIDGREVPPRRAIRILMNRGEHQRARRIAQMYGLPAPATVPVPRLPAPMR